MDATEEREVVKEREPRQNIREVLRTGRNKLQEYLQKERKKKRA